MDDWTASATAAAVPPTRAPDCPQPVTLDEARSFMDDTQPFFRKSLQIEDAHTTSLVSTDTRVNARPLTPAGAVEFQRGARGAALPQREPDVHCSVTPASQSLEMSR